MAEITPTLLSSIEKHINNYFNKDNRADNPERNHPDDFLELAGRIAEYIEKTPKTHITSASFGIQAQSHDLEYMAWHKAFARDLAVYKRARFI